ncbi:hypothetical protein BH11VER1_BH11VER1_34130 [soil metagenome]
MKSKIKKTLLAILTLTPAFAGFAGEPSPSSKQVNLPPVPPVEDAWQISATPYLWMAGLNGTVGAGGYSADIDVPFDKIIKQLDFAAAMQLEFKHRRWMLMLDGMYLKLSADSSTTPGQLFSSVGVEVQEVIAEASVGYRLWEGERGFLDAFAGVRYMYLKNSLSLNLDNTGVKNISEDISSGIVNRTSKAVNSAISEMNPELKRKISSKVSSEVQGRVEDRVSEILGRDPNLKAILQAIKNGNGQVSDALKNLIAAQVALKQSTLTGVAATASAQVAAAKARTRSQLTKAVTRAEEQLAKRIEKTITDNIPEEGSASQGWIDPIVGFRARYNISDRFYGLVRADVGGFGVGSELTWQVYAALGYQVGKKTTMELGYRNLYVDYTNGNFVFDVNTSGLQLALTRHF